eukprot:1959459-Rhodomonas_salina.3
MREELENLKLAVEKGKKGKKKKGKKKGKGKGKGKKGSKDKIKDLTVSSCSSFTQCLVLTQHICYSRTVRWTR